MIDIGRRGLASQNKSWLPVVVGQKEGELPRDADRRIFTSLLSTQLRESSLLFRNTRGLTMYCIPDARLVAGGALPLDKIMKTKMQWGAKFLDAAFEHQFRLVNYPTVLEDLDQIIGLRFDIKKISTSQYKTFLPAMQAANRCRPTEDEEDDDEDIEVALAIVSWSEGMHNSFAFDNADWSQ